MRKFQINLTYFKESGKYYSGGSYRTKKREMHEVFTEVKEMQQKGNLPGLCEGGGATFIIHVTSNSHPNAFPTLLNPLR